MKKLMIAVLFLIGFAANAQDVLPKHAMTKEQRNEAQLKKLTKGLNLTEDQQKQMSVIIAEQSDKREALMLERQKHKAEKVRLTTEERQAKAKKAVEERAATKERVRKILTAEQFAKWEEMNAQKRTDIQRRAEALKERARKAKEAEEGTQK
jgi:Spy/CpxP family protein refolding chaperone